MTSVARNCSPDTDVAVSIIVPIYNVEQYLADCVQSLIAQDCSQAIEVLLVNDCSPDDCDAICQKYAKEYPETVRYIPCEINQGVSVARNIGIDAARGDYIMFVDPDDLVPKAAISDLYNCAIQNDADIVKGNNSIFDTQHKKPARYNVDKTHVLEGADIFSALLRHEHVRGHSWGKLFRRQDFMSCRFPGGVRMAEDLVYCGRVLSTANKLVLLDKLVYEYRLRAEGSTGDKYRSGAFTHWFDSIEALSEFVETKQQYRLLLDFYIRTLNQAVKELKKVPDSLSREVMPLVIQRQKKWNVKFSTLVKGRVIATKCYWRYLMYCLIARQLISKISG